MTVDLAFTQQSYFTEHCVQVHTSTINNFCRIVIIKTKEQENVYLLY